MADEIIFKVGVNTGNTAKDISNIDKELKNVNQSAKVVGSDGASQLEELNKRVASGTLTARQLTRAVKEYETIAIQAGRTSPIGQQAIQQGAALTDELADLRNEIVRASHDGKNMQAALQLGSGVAAGYGVAQGAMALLGGEQENLQKAMVKLQAIQAVMAGVEQIRATLEKESFLMQKAKVVQTYLVIAAQKAYNVVTGASIGVTKALKLALAATGIGAIVVAVGFLASNWDKVKASVGKAAKTTTDYLNSSSKGAKFLKGYLDMMVYPITLAIKGYRMLKDMILGTSDASRKVASEQDKIHKTRMKQFEDERNKQKAAIGDMTLKIALLEAEGKSTIELRKKKLALQKADAESTLAALQATQAMLGKNSMLGKSYDDLIKNAKGVVNEVKISEAGITKEIEQAGKEREDKQKEAADKAKAKREDDAKKQIELEKTIQDLVVANIEDTNERAIAELSLQQQREKDELISKYGKNTELIKQLEEKQADEMFALMTEQDKVFDEATKASDLKKVEAAKKLSDELNKSKKAELEAKLIAIQNDFNAEQELKTELAELELVTQLENDKLTAGEKLKVQEEYNAKIRELEKATADHNKKLKQDEINNAVEWANKGLEATQNLSDAYFATKLSQVEKGSKAEENLARKQFKFNKALQLSGAVMDAGKAVIASLAQSPVAIGPVPNPAGIASLAFVAAQSIANIAKISATKFESTSSGGGGVAPPSISGSVPEVPIPEGNSTLTDGLNGGKDNKVYVLDSDITAQQDSTAKKTALATFGG